MENTFVTQDSISAMQSGIYDNRFNLIVTDPLYDYSESDKKKIHNLLLRCLKRHGTLIVFSPPENQWIHPASQYLFWEKPSSTKNVSRRYSRFVEMIFVYQNEGYTWNHQRHWSQYTNIFRDLVDDASIHPWRKPPAMLKRLILNHSNPGDFIFDPFCGSGVVGDVCLELGDRNSLCADIELSKYRK